MNTPEARVYSPKEELSRRELAIRSRHTGSQTAFQYVGELRHGKQYAPISQAKVSELERMLLLSKFEKGSYLYGKGQQHACCLFNIIVAFEWNPCYYELEQLRNTFDQAADLFFDATDGYMSLNRIIVGGPELMDCADIQIFASNRLYPRAWVNGLHIERKYQPIRIGRGYWRKNAGRAEAWYKNLGPAVLVHELFHYALGLKDDYVKLSPDDRYAIPSSSPIVHTLMANLESSELLGATEWQQLRKNPFFSWLFQRDAGEQSHTHTPQNMPPELVPAPMFHIIGSAKNAPDEGALVYLNWAAANLEKKLDQEHCWAFVLTGTPEKPEQLIAQGSVETAAPEGYRIIGACKDAYLILIGHAPLEPGTARVLLGKIKDFKNGLISIDSWKDVTPGPQAKDIPVVAVTARVVQDAETAFQADIEIRDPDKRQWKKYFFPLGQPQTSPGDTLHALDGQVLLVSKKGQDIQLIIAHYSYGYSPSAAYPAGPNPVPAGSSDGNAMVFFYDEQAATLDPADEQATHPASSLRIMTTTNLLNVSANLGQEPRSYSFALLPNKALPLYDGKPLYHPTLVLYFDQDTKKGNQDKLLTIHRLHSDGSWQPLSKYQQEFADRLLVAAQLNPDTAPGLFAAQPTAEYYRLFLI